MKRQSSVSRVILAVLILLSTIFISCQKPAAFTVTDLKLEPAEVSVNTPSTISATVSNTGETEGTYAADLLINGEKSESKDILIKPGATGVVTYTVSKSSSGVYEITVGSQKQNLTVKKLAEFAVTELKLEPAEAPVGVPCAISAKVCNTGETEGTYSAVLLVNGEKAESKDIKIKPGATESVRYTVSKSTPGSYEVALGAQKQKFTVLEMKQYLLRRDNGTFSRDWGLYDPRGQWVKLSPPATPFVIQKILVRGKRTDIPSPEQVKYTLKIHDKEFSKVLYSADFLYSKFATSYTMVEHEIKPGLTVTDDFYVDFISHSQSPPSGQTVSRVAIYLQVDFTVSTGEYAGISWLDTIDTREMNILKQRDPKFTAFSWIIQVQGTAKASATPTPTATPSPAQQEKPPVKPEIPANILEIMTKATAASTQWTTSKFDMNMAMAMEAIGGTQAGKVLIAADTTSIMDNAKKEMQMNMNMKMDMLGQSAPATKGEMYLVGGYMYTNIGGLWMKSKMTDQDWQNQQTPIIQQIELLKTAFDVTLLDTESMDNIPCNVLKITPDMNALVKWLSEQKIQGTTGQDLTKLNLSQVFKRMSMKAWIAKDSYRVMRLELDLLMEIPGDAGTSKQSFEKMTMDMSIKLKFYDYNKPVSIALPKEAINAKEMP